jgi:hypothetical protein
MFATPQKYVYLRLKYPIITRPTIFAASGLSPRRISRNIWYTGDYKCPPATACVPASRSLESPTRSRIYGGLRTWYDCEMCRWGYTPPVSSYPDILSGLPGKVSKICTNIAMNMLIFYLLPLPTGLPSPASDFLGDVHVRHA